MKFVQTATCFIAGIVLVVGAYSSILGCSGTFEDRYGMPFGQYCGGPLECGYGYPMTAPELGGNMG